MFESFKNFFGNLTNRSEDKTPLSLTDVEIDKLIENDLMGDNQSLISAVNSSKY